jgi:hypothetical protein
MRNSRWRPRRRGFFISPRAPFKRRTYPESPLYCCPSTCSIKVEKHTGDRFRVFVNQHIFHRRGADAAGRVMDQSARSMGRGSAVDLCTKPAEQPNREKPQHDESSGAEHEVSRRRRPVAKSPGESETGADGRVRPCPRTSHGAWPPRCPT